jgi:hypothetical protein
VEVALSILSREDPFELRILSREDAAEGEGKYVASTSSLKRRLRLAGGGGYGVVRLGYIGYI